jgi:F-type H+-transporting ATPase subunit beta
MKRGGANAIFTPRSGVGKVVIIESLIDAMAWNHGGHSVFIGVDDEHVNSRDMALQFHESGLSGEVTLVHAQAGDPASFRRATDEALTDAQARSGEVAIFADADFADHGEHARITSAAGDRITLIWYGDYTAGAEPEEFAHLDSVVTFELWRAYHGLWPTIDPLHSRSSLAMDERHARLRERARRLLRRFEDLRTIVDQDPRGMGALASDADRRDVERARRLHAFFSQPLAVAEMYTNLLGEFVPLADTIAGVEAILDGQVDDVSEDRLRFIGGMDRYFR